MATQEQQGNIERPTAAPLPLWERDRKLDVEIKQVRVRGIGALFAALSPHPSSVIALRAMPPSPTKGEG
jgi:hypothetical protein